MTKFQKSRVEKKPTDNTDAYLLYQQGIYMWNKRTRESIPASIRLFQQAIALDSNFALAYAAISLSYHTLFVYPVSNEDSIIDLMKVYADRALAIDPDLGASHVALGAYYAFSDIPQAVRELDRGIELDPNYSYGWLKKCMILHSNDELSKALVYADHALQLDPLSPTVLLNKAIILNLQGKSAEALEVLNRIQVLEPDFSTPYYNELLVATFLNLKKYAEALEQSAKTIPEYQAFAFAAAGERERAMAIRDSLENGELHPVIFHGILQFYLEGKDAAFDFLMNAIGKMDAGERETFRAEIQASDFFVAELRADPKFAIVKQQIGWKPLP